MKKFEVSAGPMISPLPEYLLCLKETKCKNQKEYEFEDKCVSVKHKKINPCPIELKGVKLIKLKDNHRVLMLEFDESNEIKYSMSTLSTLQGRNLII